LIYQMLEKERDRRVPSMRQVAAELEAIRSGKSGGFDKERVAQTQGDQQFHARHYRMVELPAQTTPLTGRETELGQIQGCCKTPPPGLLPWSAQVGLAKRACRLRPPVAWQKNFPMEPYSFHSPPSARSISWFRPSEMPCTLRFSPGSSQKEQLINRLSWSKCSWSWITSNICWTAPDLLSDLLAAAPQLRLLVSSRERLNLQEEWVFEVDGLPYPPPGEIISGEAGSSWLQNFSAVQLFVERARRADPKSEAG
jgi:hypothetical protein